VNLVYTPTDASIRTTEDATLGSFRGQAAQQPPAHLNQQKQQTAEQLQQEEFHNDPSLSRQSSTASRHGREKQKAQWDWDWVKKTTADRMKQSLGWPEAGSHTNGKKPGSSASSPATGGVSNTNGANEDEDDLLSYHRHLEKEHSPHAYLRHSPTLTFDRIYVLSLPHRTDRRSRMSKIARALGFQFTFVDATSKESPIIGWIAERVREIRDKKVKILASILGRPESEIGGMGTGSLWLKGDDPKTGLTFPDLTTLDDRWTIDSLKAAALEKASSQAKEEEVLESDYSGEKVVDWVTYLESTDKLDLLKPNDPHVNVTELLHDPVEPLPARQVNDGVVATWYSQTRVWKKIIENKDRSALILEDDVDIEWDIERIWPNVERSLSTNWEIVFLGHCWGRELGSKSLIGWGSFLGYSSDTLTHTFSRTPVCSPATSQS